MKVLAVDAGVANIGCAVMERIIDNPIGEIGWYPAELVLIETEANPRKQKIRAADVDMDRVMEATRQLSGIIRLHEIRRMCVEVPSGAQSAAAMKYLSMAGSIAACTAAHFDLYVEWYSPQDVRRTLCGKSSASKEEAAAIAEAAYPQVVEKFPQKGRREHVNDAIALFLTALRTGNITKA